MLKVSHLQPGSDDSHVQILAFRDNEEIALGLVRSIYRGASTKDGIVRRLRVTKPAAHLLPLSSVSRVRLVRLTEISEGRYFCCALSPTLLVDPLGTVLGEFTPVEQRIGLKFQFLFAEGVLRELKTIGENPDLFSEQPEPSQAGLAEPENSTLEPYPVADFKRSVQGTRNIVSFLQCLPKARVRRIFRDLFSRTFRMFCLARTMLHRGSGC